jgi:hypothetical protein
MRLALLLVALAGTAEARFVETRTSCQAACPTKVTSFCGGLRPARYRKCRTNTWKLCRRWGIDLICPAPQAPTTTPTTTISTTTTTTLPSRFAPYAGRWQFTGYVVQDTCPTPPTGLQDNVTITVLVGGGASGTVDSIPGVVFSGSFDDTNHVMLMGALFEQQGCSVRGAFDMADPITVPEGGGFGVDVTCGPNECQRIWIGTYMRL